MGRKKQLGLLILIVLGTASQIFAQTTYYEVWRNTTDNPNTAVRIEQWLTDTYYNDDDPSLAPGQHYFYWIRALACEEREDSYYGLGYNKHIGLKAVFVKVKLIPFLVLSLV